LVGDTVAERTEVPALLGILDVSTVHESE